MEVAAQLLTITKWFKQLDISMPQSLVQELEQEPAINQESADRLSRQFISLLKDGTLLMQAAERMWPRSVGALLIGSQTVWMSNWATQFDHVGMENVSNFLMCLSLVMDKQKSVFTQQVKQQIMFKPEHLVLSQDVPRVLSSLVMMC